MEQTVNNRCVSSDVKLGEGVKIAPFTNLYGCTIGDNSKVGTFVEIQKNAQIGANCKIQSHTFICEGVIVEDECFIGHGVTFINDPYPRSTNANGELQGEQDWAVVPTIIKRGASIGSGATVMCGVVIGEGAIVGAGSMVTKSVQSATIVAGNPARFKRRIDE
ncbi:acyltransferase [Chitinispirillales bacterium ANBcel5]|uniref:acyltransferase n=1 Tax=Cellulosispirillum alkaliphilum TaxID=3039283 RepID=UPI002A512F30|nr:acyltransferase [Chitinispirillales bacterium ANBcel5]